MFRASYIMKRGKDCLVRFKVIVLCKSIKDMEREVDI